LESFKKCEEKLLPWIETCKQSLLWKYKAPRSEADRKPTAQQTWDTSLLQYTTRIIGASVTNWPFYSTVLCWAVC